jgi:hypothetical protein
MATRPACVLAHAAAAARVSVERAVGGGDSFEKRYKVRASLCCCGRVSNCCAPSCCKPDAVHDILDTHGNVVAHIQMTYAVSGDGAVHAVLLG